MGGWKKKLERGISKALGMMTIEGDGKLEGGMRQESSDRDRGFGMEDEERFSGVGRLGTGGRW